MQAVDVNGEGLSPRSRFAEQQQRHLATRHPLGQRECFAKYWM
jgi:hypothetical protein